jgi:hypothetical protein
MPSGNDEKATMAPASGEKRDRNSANTDQPHYSPNPQDTKLLCVNDKDAIGRPMAKESIESANSADSKGGSGNVVGRFLSTEAGSKVIDVESDLADEFDRCVESPLSETDDTAKQLFPNPDKADQASDDNDDKQPDIVNKADAENFYGAIKRMTIALAAEYQNPPGMWWNAKVPGQRSPLHCPSKNLKQVSLGLTPLRLSPWRLLKGFNNGGSSATRFPDLPNLISGGPNRR